MHLLATHSAKLDETDAAIDLEQSPADVVVLSFADSDLSALAAAWQSDAGILPALRLASLKKLKHPMSVDLYVERVIAHARVVIVRCLGGFDYWRYGLENIAAIARKHGILFAALPGDDRPDFRLAEISTVSPETLSRLDHFFREGGVRECPPRAPICRRPSRTGYPVGQSRTDRTGGRLRRRRAHDTA